MAAGQFGTLNDTTVVGPDNRFVNVDDGFTDCRQR